MPLGQGVAHLIAASLHEVPQNCLAPSATTEVEPKQTTTRRAIAAFIVYVVIANSNCLIVLVGIVPLGYSPDEKAFFYFLEWQFRILSDVCTSYVYS
jgi:hypothetical protein